MANPKAALAMTAIVTLGIDVETPVWVGASLVLGLAMLSAIGHCAHALALSTHTVAVAYARCRRGIEGVLGVFFCFVGLDLLLFAKS